MNLYFPVALVYIALAIAALAVLWLIVGLFSWAWSWATDETLKALRIKKNLIAFINHKNRREFGTIAEIRSEMDARYEEYRQKERRLKYRADWALYHLNLATFGQVGRSGFIYSPGDPEELGEWQPSPFDECCNAMQPQFDAWLADKVEEYKEQKASLEKAEAES